MAGTATLDDKILNPLQSALRGPLVCPGDERYDASRAVHNGMIDRRPLAIAHCADVADVIASVRAAGESGLAVAVRGGGHSGPGFGVCDDGLVIDLSGMRGVRVDPDARTVRVDGGATWGQVDHAAHPFGLATPSGVISTTGVGGLTLGGGHGYLSRKYGLTVDNLLAADVVLADGSFVKASADSHPDLFWAIRGGGGNFGIVTSFEFRLQPVDTVLAGPMLWSLDQMAEAMQWYEQMLARAGRDVYAFFTSMQVPPDPMFPTELHGRTVCGVLWCCLTDGADARSAMESGRAFAPPLFEHIGQMPFPALQRAFDPLYPAGVHAYWKGHFVRTFTPAAIQTHVRFARALPTMLSISHFYPIDGAVHDVAAADTAFPRRDVRWSQVIVGADPDPAKDGVIKKWARDYWEAVKSESEAGAYVNFMMDEEEGRLRATYGPNYQRLTAIKKKYDPANLFRVNHNIPPA
jgi:FAD/FMN-containing dehydrogenase